MYFLSPSGQSKYRASFTEYIWPEEQKSYHKWDIKAFLSILHFLWIVLESNEKGIQSNEIIL